MVERSLASHRGIIVCPSVHLGFVEWCLSVVGVALLLVCVSIDISAVKNVFFSKMSKIVILKQDIDVPRQDIVPSIVARKSQNKIYQQTRFDSFHAHHS